MVRSVLFVRLRHAASPLAPAVPMPKTPRSTLDEDALAARRSEGGRATVALRRSRTRDAIVSAALGLRAAGIRPTQEAVRAALASRGGQSESTVYRHWPAVRAALATAVAAVEAEPAEAASADPGPIPAPERPRYPTLLCEDLGNIIRVYVARGERRADIARATALELADVVALVGPDPLADDEAPW